jgi:hypothetical protein
VTATSKELNLLDVSTSTEKSEGETYSGSPGKIWPARSLIKSARSRKVESASCHGTDLSAVGKDSIAGAGSGPRRRV